MANNELTEDILRTENKYLTKVIALAVAALISTLIFIGNWQVSATKANATAIDKLSETVIESNIVNNNRFNIIDNRWQVGREKSISAYKELRKDIDRNTDEIKLIKGELKK